MYDESGTADATSSTSVATGAMPGPVKADSQSLGLCVTATNGFVNIGSASDIDNISPVSYCWWQHTSSLGGGNYGRVSDKTNTLIVHLDGTDNNDDGGTASELRFQVATSGTDILAMSHIGFPHGVWNFCVVTWDGTVGSSPSGVSIYRDGVKDTDINISGTPSGSRTTDASGNSYIGNRPSGGTNRNIDCHIAEYAIFGKVLSDANVVELYNAAGSDDWLLGV